MSLFLSSFSDETEMFQPAPPSQIVSGVLVLQEAAWLRIPADSSQTLSVGPSGWLVIAVAAGKAHLTSGVLNCVLHGGHACVFPAGENVTLTVSDETVQAAALHLSGSVADSMLSPAEHQDAYFYPQGGSAVQEVAAALKAAEDNGLEVTGEAASLQAYALLLRLQGTASAPQDTPAYPPLITAAIALIQEQFAYLTGITELAEQLEVTPAHLIRQFTKYVGMTPGKFLTRVRIERAKMLLRDPDISVQSVAEASGFANAGYFIKVFRKETGLTPGQFAAAAAQEPTQPMPDKGMHYLF